jgi:FAD-dependent oxidoreductase domain-containing protein 1
MKRIVIVGGGIMGSCIAYHLALAGAAADVVVIEPDPTYEFAATPRAVGGIRLQHALFENVEMSLYGDSVYSDFANQVTGGNVQYDPQFYRIGYLYMVQGAAQVATLASVADMLESKECGYTGSTGQRCAAATPHSISTTRMPER